MPHLSPAVHHLFAAQHGVASLDQLLATGLSVSQLRRLESRGAVERVLNRAYRSPSVPFDDLARCAAVCLARPAVVIAGPTAGRIRGYRRNPRDLRIHFLSPPGSHPVAQPWAVPYRTTAFHACDVVSRPDGIRLTTHARTALDLARWLRGDDLLSVIEQARHDGQLDDAELWAVAADWLCNQRPWAWAYVRQLGRLLPGGPAESHPEVRVAAALTTAGVVGVVRQFPIELPGYGSARFDLAVPGLRWAIEVDVHPTHTETSGAARDERRDTASIAIGWTVSRVRRGSYEREFAGAIGELVGEYRRLLATRAA